MANEMLSAAYWTFRRLNKAWRRAVLTNGPPLKGSMLAPYVLMKPDERARANRISERINQRLGLSGG